MKKLYGSVRTKTIALLKTFKIFDLDGTLSITNTGVMLLLGKIAVSPTLDWPTASGLLLALLSYNYKKTLNHKKTAQDDAGAKQLAEIERKIVEINQAFSFKNLK